MLFVLSISKCFSRSEGCWVGIDCWIVRMCWLMIITMSMSLNHCVGRGGCPDCTARLELDPSTLVINPIPVCIPPDLAFARVACQPSQFFLPANLLDPQGNVFLLGHIPELLVHPGTLGNFHNQQKLQVFQDSCSHHQEQQSNHKRTMTMVQAVCQLQKKRKEKVRRIVFPKRDS